MGGPTRQGLVGLGQPIADSVCVGCCGEFLTHPSTLQRNDTVQRHQAEGLCVCSCFNSELSATGTTLSEQRDKGD